MPPRPAHKRRILKNAVPLLQERDGKLEAPRIPLFSELPPTAYKAVANPPHAGPNAASAATPPPPRSRRQKQRRTIQFKILPRRAKGAAPCAAGQRGNSHPHRRSAPQPVACIIAKAARFPGNCCKAQRPKARPPGAGPLFQSGKEDFKRCGLLSFQSFHPQPANPPQSSGMQARAWRAQRRRNGARPQRVGPHAASAATPPPAAKQAANLEPTQFRILPRRAKGAAPALPGGQHGNQHPRPPRAQRRRNGARLQRVGPRAASAASPPPPRSRR